MPTFRNPDKIDKIRNPSEEQLRDAEKHGIDLKDPMVVAELERLQTEADGDRATLGQTCTASRRVPSFQRRLSTTFHSRKRKFFFLLRSSATLNKLMGDVQI